MEGGPRIRAGSEQARWHKPPPWSRHSLIRSHVTVLSVVTSQPYPWSRHSPVPAVRGHSPFRGHCPTTVRPIGCGLSECSLSHRNALHIAPTTPLRSGRARIGFRECVRSSKYCCLVSFIRRLLKVRVPAAPVLVVVVIVVVVLSVRVFTFSHCTTTCLRIRVGGPGCALCGSRFVAP